MGQRVTQEYLDTIVLYVNPPNARITGSSVTVLTSPTNAQARVTESSLEVLWLTITAQARITNTTISVLLPSSLSIDLPKLRTIPETRCLNQMGAIY